MSLTTSQILGYLQTGGVTGILAFLIVAGFKGWMVFGRELTACQRDTERAVAAVTTERDEWKGIALKGMEATERALEAARIAAMVNPRQPSGGGP